MSVVLALCRPRAVYRMSGPFRCFEFEIRRNPRNTEMHDILLAAGMRSWLFRGLGLLTVSTPHGTGFGVDPDIFTDQNSVRVEDCKSRETRGELISLGDVGVVSTVDNLINRAAKKLRIWKIIRRHKADRSLDRLLSCRITPHLFRNSLHF